MRLCACRPRRVLAVIGALVSGLAMVAVGSVRAASTDVIEVKRMGTELARDIAQGALDACREQGYQVSVVVVDRHGLPVVMMRDILASRFTIQIAEEKANAVVLSGIASGAFRENRADIRPEMNHVDGVLMLDGALPVEAAGMLLGAVGVSGAPGGDKDRVCAKAGLNAVESRLQFVD